MFCGRITGDSASANTSSIVSMAINSSFSRTSSGMSSTSFRFAAGNMSARNPARYAASAFSRMPPTGSTLPRRLTSPVMATSWWIARSLSTDAITSPIVMPALGPSFGTPAAGKCTWMSNRPKASDGISNACARERTYECAACTDSFMTSPSCPVSTTRPEPGILMASITSTSPPAAVHASPIATPTSSCLPAISGW